MKAAGIIALFGIFGLNSLATELPLLAVPPQKDGPNFIHTANVIYGQRSGMDLSLDVFEPAQKNGAAILYIVSGGYASSRNAIEPETYYPLLTRGYTVFAVVHSPRTQAHLPQIEEDIHRAVRFVRHNAKRWEIDPNRFGIIGGSSGGQLALTIGTQGGPSASLAKDPVENENSTVQAVACFYPPTDFLNWSKPDEDAVEYGASHGFEPPLGPVGMSRQDQRKVEYDVSPLNFITPAMPPTLLIHGEADEIVPLYQTLRFAMRCREVGAPCEIIVKPAAAHSYPGWRKDLTICADWFDRHLIDARLQQP